MSRMAGILAGLLIFIGISHVLDKMYVDEYATDWCRIMWHHFYEDEGKIDNLYLGSSHVHCDIDPSVLHTLNGEYHFNLATPYQPLNASYYLLQEADRINELQHVYLEMYYMCNYDDGTLKHYEWNWCNTDYMKPSLNKAAYMLAIGGEDQYVNILLPFSRYRVSLGDWTYVKERLEGKSQESYRSYQREYDHGEGKVSYERQGYFKSQVTYKDYDKLCWQGAVLSGYSMGKKNEAYCRRIIEYCQKKQIPITLFASPIYDLQLLSTLDYDDYIVQIRALAAEYGIPFYDFNLAKEEYLPLQSGIHYYDPGHLNQYGAELFTPFFYQVVSGKEADTEKYFYDSYEEKLRAHPPAIYGAYYRHPKEQEEMTTMWVASNRDSGMEYRIILTPEEGEPYVLQDFDENREFLVPRGERGICTLSARMTGGMEELQVMEIHYDTNY